MFMRVRLSICPSSSDNVSFIDVGKVSHSVFWTPQLGRLLMLTE